MKKIKLNSKTLFPKKIKSTPENLDLKGIKKNKCTNNSKIIIQNNPSLDIKYIEGFLLITENKIERAVAHAWNKIGDDFFDVSAKLIDTTEFGNECLIQYFPIFEVELYELSDEISGILPFTDKFKPFVLDANKKFLTK